MRVLLSPAKTFRKNALSPAAGSSQPQFLAEAETLMAGLRKKSPAALVQLMDISPALAEENAQRHLDWSVPFHPGNAKAALLAFHGEVYRNLGADQWTGPEFEVAQRTLRIISGLYGLLRPLDLIQEYRLEMGTSWAPGRAKNLYAFWGDTLRNALDADAAGTPIVNLASQEYAKAVQLKACASPVVTCHFKEQRGEAFKMIGTYAKAARGKMARFIVKERLTTTQDLQAFQEDGYAFNPALSSPAEFTFTRIS